MVKIASLASWFLGFGFGIPCIYGIWSLLKGKGIGWVMGFPTYGHGPFEKIGVESTVTLLIGFLIVCSLQCLVGFMLWNGEKGGAIISFVLIPLEVAFYIGFALPFGPPFIIARTILVILSWSTLIR